MLSRCQTRKRSENASFNADLERLASHNVLEVNPASTDMLSRFSVRVPLDFHASTSLSASKEMLVKKKGSRCEKLRERNAGLAASLGSAEAHNFNFAF